MVRTTTDDATDVLTPEDTAEAFARDQSEARFNTVVSQVRDEYRRDDHDHVDGFVLSPTGLAVRLCADAIAADDDTAVDDAHSTIDFDGSDEVTVEYDGFAQDDPHATPTELARLAGLADAATNYTVRFRDGAGSVRIYVEVPRRDDDDA
jgi:hypothetical protein